ncbi:MAG: hypothetical protein ACO260_05295 [Hylemonella sp.]
MSIPEYQGEMQPGAQKQDMSKGGPEQTPRKNYQKPSASVAPRGVGMARNKQCKMY